MSTPKDDSPIKEQPMDGTDTPGNGNDDDEAAGFSLTDVLFRSMARYPWPYLVTLPVIFLCLIGFGWFQDDIVETEVTNIWIPTSGSYANDVKYAKDLGKDDLDASSFAAMSIARDGKNLFTESRLEEIRARMEKTESTTIEFKGKTYRWEDFCVSNGGFPYEFPCARLSYMDVFQEANWYMNYTGPDSFAEGPIPAPKQDLYRRTWYKEMIQALLVQPRIPRFGVMTNDCQVQCASVLRFRLSAASPGFRPFSLFSDLGNMEMSDGCRVCIEAGYNQTIVSLIDAIPGTFQVLALEMQRFAASTTDSAAAAVAAQVATNARILANTISANDIKEFHFYYVTRGTYASLGAGSYLGGLQRLGDVLAQCQQFAAMVPTLVCPDISNVTLANAEEALRRHADTTFSSVTTAGSPFPFWSEGDGTGFLFAGRSPVGGSGVDMSADIFSMIGYLNSPLFGQPGWSPIYGADGVADPTDPSFDALVLKNPLYAWFMASLVEVDSETSCGNGFLSGTNLGDEGALEEVDQNTTMLAMAATQFWCTKYSIPNTGNPGTDGPYTQQYFARMWYDRLIDSPAFLGLTEGADDSYSWTTGQGCGYSLKGQRDPYTGATDAAILENGSRDLYYIDEGEVVGVISPAMIIGDESPPVGEYSQKNPLTEVGVIQALYAALLPKDIIQRVRNCNRPDGPAEDLTEEDAEALLSEWKEAMENSWTEGWDDEANGDVQFVAFFDDNAVIGTTGRLLDDITLDNNKLTFIAIFCIALFSVMFLFHCDQVESRVLITLVGVALVVLAYFAAVGFAVLVGTKISIAMAWTLPFIIIGLGVDDMYIILHSLQRQGGYTETHFLRGMKEVFVPITMTSLVNASMFAILNISDIPAIYLTARVANYCIIALYFGIVFCFPAFCFLGFKRQAAGKRDICFCFYKKRSDDNAAEGTEISADIRSVWLYDKFYEPLVLGTTRVRVVSHLVIWSIAAALLGIGVYGITQREVGLGLEDYFPTNTQAYVWANKRTEALASWSIGMNWGALEYTKPETQMKMIKQFEDVVGTPHVAEVDTTHLWLANFILWGTRLCEENFDREDFETLKCGRDKIFSPGLPGPDSICGATWTPNNFGLREKVFSDIDDLENCYPNEGGICRPGDRMHPLDMSDLGIDPVLNKTDVFCPTIDGWSDEQWQFCLVQWRNTTGFSGGRFVLGEDQGSSTDCAGDFNKDENFTWPLPFSSAPTMFAIDLFTNLDTLDLLKETSVFCDDNEELHCWLSGVPSDYWQQYLNISDVLVSLAGYSTLVGFAVSFILLFAKLFFEKRHPPVKVFWGSLIGALLIAVTIVMSLVTVIGLSVLAGVSLTGLSNMSFVLSVAFSVEYSVHIISRWLRADQSYQTGLDRVKYTMSFLKLPTFMSFVSSTIGVVCLAFTKFNFSEVFFFRPLIIVMVCTYFYGCYWLPALLTLIDFDIVKLGKAAPAAEDRTSFDADKEGTQREDQEYPKEEPLPATKWNV